MSDVYYEPHDDLGPIAERCDRSDAILVDAAVWIAEQPIDRWPEFLRLAVVEAYRETRHYWWAVQARWESEGDDE